MKSKKEKTNKKDSSKGNDKSKKSKNSKQKEIKEEEDSKSDKQVKYRTAWNLYMMDVRLQLQQEFPDKKFPEITKIASERFKNLDPAIKEKYEKQAAESKAKYAIAVQKQGTDQQQLSKAEKERKAKISPYFRFMSLKHEELRKNAPDLTYKERAQIVFDVWKSLSMIEKTFFESDESAATASLEHHEEVKEEEENKDGKTEKPKHDISEENTEEHTENDTGDEHKESKHSDEPAEEHTDEQNEQNEQNEKSVEEKEENPSVDEHKEEPTQEAEKPNE